MNQKINISLIIIILASVFTLNAQINDNGSNQKSKTKVEQNILSDNDSLKQNNRIYRIEIGYNNPNRYGSGVSSTFFNGIKLGGTVEFSLKNKLSLLSGVLYNLVYSDKLQKYPNLASVKYTTWGHFIDIPLRLTYTLPLSKNLKVFGFAGPNLNIGLSQNMKITTTQESDVINPLYVTPGNFNLYSGTNYQLNRLNLQVGIGAGIQWKKYQLKGGYDFGINNLNKIDTGKQYQKGWYVSASYSF